MAKLKYFSDFSDFFRGKFRSAHSIAFIGPLSDVKKIVFRGTFSLLARRAPWHSQSETGWLLKFMSESFQTFYD